MMPAIDSDAETLPGPEEPDDCMVPLGTILSGNYRLDKAIGRGGMAEVFEAEDLLLARRVAVKISRRRGDDGRIIDEACTLAQLHHAHLPVVHSAGRHNGFSYVVLELLKGVTLADKLATTQRAGASLALVEVVEICMVISAALGAIHEAGMCHRDVKPSRLALLERRHGDEHRARAGACRAASRRASADRPGVFGRKAELQQGAGGHAGR